MGIPPVRLYVSLSRQESDAFRRMCTLDGRPGQFQFSWLVREEAKRRGLWIEDDDPPTQEHKDAALSAASL